MMKWDDIYEAAIDKGCGEYELKRKDLARHEIVCFIEDNFGFNIEADKYSTVIESVEDLIAEYCENYNIEFNSEGQILCHRCITEKDRLEELSIYYGFICGITNEEKSVPLNDILDVLEVITEHKPVRRE